MSVIDLQNLQNVTYKRDLQNTTVYYKYILSFKVLYIVSHLKSWAKIRMFRV